jgi:hypothetical protein
LGANAADDCATVLGALLTAGPSSPRTIGSTLLGTLGANAAGPRAAVFGTDAAGAPLTVLGALLAAGPSSPRAIGSTLLGTLGANAAGARAAVFGTDAAGARAAVLGALLAAGPSSPRMIASIVLAMALVSCADSTISESAIESAPPTLRFADMRERRRCVGIGFSVPIFHSTVCAALVGWQRRCCRKRTVWR